MLSKRFSYHLLFGLLLPSILSCGKNISQILFHVHVDQRAAESLTGAMTIPTGMTPADPLKFSFAIFGDVQVHQDGKTLLPRFKADLVAQGIEFFVVLGDLTEDGNSEEFKAVKTALDGVGIPYYATIGNHDLFQDSTVGGWEVWKKTFGPATYAVNIANVVRFLFLDTASGDIGPTQFEWLRTQLLTPVPFTFVGSHYPIYDGVTPIIWRLSSLEERYKLTSLLQESNVFAYIAGHIHGYRENQVAKFKHFVTGSMFPFELDYGSHGYLLFTYDHGKMTWKQVTWEDIP